MNKAAYQFPSLVVFMLAMAWTSSVAHAGPPTDTLQAKQAVLYELLRQPHRNPRKINAILDELLDHATMCQSALAGAWTIRSAEEKARYAEVCKQIIRRSYAADLMATRNHDVQYVDERLGGSSATVETLVVSREWPSNAPVEMTYVMTERNGAWQVSDILVRGRSTVQSQRIAYARVIARHGFSVLLRKLESQVAGGRDPF